MFTQLTERDLEQHVKILGWVYIVTSFFMILIGGLVFMLLAGIGLFSGEAEAVAIMSLVGFFVAGLMLTLSIPGVLAGYGLLQHANWGRILAIVLGLLNLVNFPIGTVVGVYALWVLFQQSAEPFFASAVPAQPTSTPAPEA